MSETRLHLRVYEEEKAQIRQRAADLGMTMSEFVRRQVATEERRTLKASIYPQKVRTPRK